MSFETHCRMLKNDYDQKTASSKYTAQTLLLGHSHTHKFLRHMRHYSIQIARSNNFNCVNLYNKTKHNYYHIRVHCSVLTPFSHLCIMQSKDQPTNGMHNTQHVANNNHNTILHYVGFQTSYYSTVPSTDWLNNFSELLRLAMKRRHQIILITSWLNLK